MLDRRALEALDADAWSDREFASADFRDASDAFQGAGIAPAAIAELTYAAILADRFYVFTGDTTGRFLDATTAGRCAATTRR